MKNSILKFGSPWCQRHWDELGIETAERVSELDLTWRIDATGENVRVESAWVDSEGVHIGCWIWYDAEDFDTDAEYKALSEEDFEAWEITKIVKAIEK